MFEFAAKKDYEEIYFLFHTCFHDSIDEVRTFTEFFSQEKDFQIVIGKIQGTIATMAYLIPAHYKHQPAYYIYGVCTHPDYRNRGLSTRLLHYVKCAAKMLEKSWLFLVPASDSLVDFYKKQGFLSYPVKRLADTATSEAIAESSNNPFLEEISETEYLSLRKNFQSAEHVLSLTDRGNLYALTQREPDVRLYKLTLPQLTNTASVTPCPVHSLGCILWFKKTETVLLELTTWNVEEQQTAIRLLSNFFSQKESGKSFSCQLGVPLCVCPIGEKLSNDFYDNTSKNISDTDLYFAFPMDTIL